MRKWEIEMSHWGNAFVITGERRGQGLAARWLLRCLRMLAVASFTLIHASHVVIFLFCHPYQA